MTRRPSPATYKTFDAEHRARAAAVVGRKYQDKGGKRRCNKCGQWKPLETGYYLCGGKRKGICKDCQKGYYYEHKESFNGYGPNPGRHGRTADMPSAVGAMPPGEIVPCAYPNCVCRGERRELNGHWKEHRK